MISLKLTLTFATVISLGFPAQSMAVNCPPGTPPQKAYFQNSEIVIADSQDGLVCHSATLDVQFINPRTQSIGSVVRAQIDTGSDLTVVGPDVVAGLNLQAIGQPVTLQAGAAGVAVAGTIYEAH
ncbi:hypothetical protein ACCT19_33170, partial [Rhizobium ruizarguesonis]